VTLGLHGEQLRLKLGVGRMATQRFAAAPRQGNGGLRLVPMVGEVTHAGQDVGAELGVVAQLDESEGAVEVLGCDCVTAGVVRHPAGHLGQGRCCREEALVPKNQRGAHRTSGSSGRAATGSSHATSSAFAPD
jgi:hypothetical protein